MEIKISFLGLLQLVLSVLKLIGVITWSWWLVLLPTIIVVGLFILYTVGVVVYYLIKENTIHKR